MRWTALPVVALATLVLAGCGGSASTKVSSAKDRVVVGYYADWDMYVRGFPIYLPISQTTAKLMIDAEHITHLDYAFAKIDRDTNKIVQVDSYTDPINFKNLVKLKKEFPKLKTLIAIGGWTLSDLFSRNIADDAKRKALAASAVGYMKQNHFDGVDIDWEFPVCCGDMKAKEYADRNNGDKRYSPDDKHNFTLWLQELRHELDDQGKKDGVHYLLTIAASASPDIAKKAYEFKDIGKVVDWVDVMAYDYHGAWEKVANHNAPLHQNPGDPDNGKGMTVQDSLALWEKEGVPASKLVMGVPFYGRGWDGCPPKNHGLFQTCKSASLKGGTWVKLDPTAYANWDYWDLKKNYVDNKASGYVRYWDAASGVPYLYNPKTQNWISYDDDQSVALKGRYIVDHGLKGGMFWEMDLDKNSGLEKTLYNTVMQQPRAGSAAGK
jgi:chitinase